MKIEDQRTESQGYMVEAVKAATLVCRIDRNECLFIIAGCHNGKHVRCYDVADGLPVDLYYGERVHILKAKIVIED